MKSPSNDQGLTHLYSGWRQLLVGSAALLCSSLAHAQPTYEVTDLGVLPGGSHSEARAINNNGVVVGYSETANAWHRGFIWENGVMAELPGGASNVRSWASDINDAGQIAGVIMDAESNQTATLWENRTPTSLGTFGGAQSGAMAIDESGRVVGWAMFSPDPGNRRFRPFVYENGALKNLGLPSSEPYAEARGISGNGRFIVGGGPISDRSAQMSGPILFDFANGPMAIGTLGGRTGFANDVNNNGWVVGATDTGVLGASGYYLSHAFLYANEKMIDLEVPYGNTSWAHAVNNNNVIVGSSWDDSRLMDPKHAFVRFDTRCIDLNTLLPPGSPWTILQAFDINDLGQIVGVGMINGAQHAVLLSPQ